MMKLSDCCSFQEGYVNPAQSNAEYFDGDIKWLRSTDLTDGPVYNTSRTLTSKGFKSAGKSAILFKKNTLAISKSGTIGTLGILQDEMCGNRAIINIDVKDNKADLKYIFYLLKNNRKQLIKAASGSIQKNLYISILGEVDVPHSFNEQNLIGKTLATLDDKIELNNKINQELEKTAKDLYNYWFVQFDFPDGNKRPYKSSGGKMVYNEILKREVPEGWTVDNFNKYVTIGSGYPFNSNDYDKSGEWKIVTIKNVQDGYLDLSTIENITKIPENAPRFVKLDIGDVLISLTGNVGRTCLVDADNLLLNQRVGKILTNDTFLLFSYLFLSTKENKARLEQISNGSSQQNLSPLQAVDFMFCVPRNDILNKFNKIIQPIYDKLIFNKQESRRLTILRDFLLPMLMNGQVSVSD